MDGRNSRQATPLPVGFAFDGWHNVAAEVRGSSISVEVTDARLNDPYAVARRTLPAQLGTGAAGFASRGRGAEVDNFAAAGLYVPNTAVAPTPGVGSPSSQHSDEFDDGTLDAAWSWAQDRRDPDAQEIGDAYRWPVELADITGPGNDASVLLRDAPQGEYVVETKLTVDLGVETVRNFQQGGLVAYLGDDHFVRLSHVAIWNTRQTEFGKEMPYDMGRLSYGGMLVGPPADTTWLRLAHRVDQQNGKHEFRADTSRDGQTWVRGGTWTLPAGTDPRIGLISHGKRDPNDPSATSEFDYFRVYTP